MQHIRRRGQSELVKSPMIGGAIHSALRVISTRQTHSIKEVSAHFGSELALTLLRMPRSCGHNSSAAALAVRRRKSRSLHEHAESCESESQ